MTVNEFKAKLIILGFKPKMYDDYSFRYKNNMNIYIARCETVYYSYTSSNEYINCIDMNNSNVMRVIIKFIEDNPNDC